MSEHTFVYIDPEINFENMSKPLQEKYLLAKKLLENEKYYRVTEEKLIPVDRIQ